MLDLVQQVLTRRAELQAAARRGYRAAVAAMRTREAPDPEIAIPAFLTMMTIPLTFSIANGLAFGLTAFTLMKIVRGKFREVNWFVYVLTGLFVFRFFFLSRS